MLIKRLWAPVVWALIILLLTGAPGTYFPRVETFWEWLSPDKLVHVIIFGIQTLLILLAFKKQYIISRQRLIYYTFVFVITTLFALLTEILQTYLFIGRDGNIYDFIANVAGVIIGFMAYFLLNYKKKNASN
jgi:VanZ family protein